ncbi:hypothetical protein NIES4075_13300 [Tolypothrix sp. NIES-4075]|uniref:hypothetical protein n=1 Tax=Tolypothrix sp. NIES-4075 TaxID=2005459 RepID=UPI000B652E28|nr:hypothetical protein NIES4075_13300 [Tolypothrix sp. NIES-4075]
MSRLEIGAKMKKAIANVVRLTLLKIAPCFSTIIWKLIDKPKSVPIMIGLVVKKVSNIFA